MNTSIILENITEGKLQEMLDLSLIKAIEAAQTKKIERYISRNEGCELLGISLPSLDKAIRNGTFCGYRINGRVLLKESEITLSKIPIRKRR